MKVSSLVGRNFEISMKIKPRNLTGILAATWESNYGTEPKREYFYLQLLNGNIIFLVKDANKIGSPNNVTFTAPDGFWGNDGWHFIQATARKNEIELQVDFKRFSSKDSDTTDDYVHSDGKVYVGSHPDKTTLPEIETRSDFLGCIKDIEINGFPVETLPEMMMGKVKESLSCN